MPAAIPVIAVVAAKAVATELTLGTLATAAVVTAAGVAGGMLAGSMVKKPSLSMPDYHTEMQDRTATIRSAVASHKIIYGKAMVSGPIVFITSTGHDHKYAHVAIPFAGHECESIEEIWFDDKISTAYDTSKFRIKKHLGGPGQVADADMVAECPEIDGTFIGHDITWAYIRFEYDTNAWPTGLPRTIKALIKGKKLYDPRTGLTTWSDNWGLAMRDYAAGDYGLSASADELDDTNVAAVANISDEQVALPLGGTQARYTVNGVVDTSMNPADNLDAMASAGAGFWSYISGKIQFFPGAYVPPTGNLSDDDLRGTIKIRPRTPRQDLFNSVKGVYTSPDNMYQPTDFPPVTNPMYVAQDDNRQIPHDITLPFTDDPTRAQRISKIFLEKARQPITVDFPAKWSALDFSAGQTVTVTLSAGRTPDIWKDKEFTIIDWQLAEDGGGIDLVLQEYAAESFAWNGGDATTVDPAPDSNMPDPRFVEPPINLAVSEELYTTRDGLGVKAKGILTWQDGGSFGSHYLVEYKLHTDTTYTRLPIVDGAASGAAVSVEITDMATGVYDFKVTAKSYLGVSSAPANLTATITGLSADPADMTNFSMQIIASAGHFSWDLSPDLDVRIGGRVRIRHTPNLTAPTWASATDIGSTIPGNATNAVLPLLAGTYLAKFVDVSNHESPNAAEVKTTVSPDMLSWNVVAAQTEHPAFTGTMTNMQALDGSLRFLAMSPITTGSYEFPSAGYVDLGSIQTCRLTSRIEFVADDASDLIDSRTGNVDDWADWDNTANFTDVQAALYVSTTDDDPSGTPTWSSWRRFLVGDHTARAFKFKLVANSEDASHQILITALEVVVDMPDRTQGARGLLSSATSATHVTYPRPFKIVPALGVTASDLDTGDYIRVTNETSDGFDITIYNASGAMITKTFNYTSRGY